MRTRGGPSRGCSAGRGDRDRPDSPRSLHAGDIASDVFESRGQFAIAAPGYEDVGAFVHELLRGRKADAAIAAGDERNLSFELAHGGPPRFSRELSFSGASVGRNSASAA